MVDTTPLSENWEKYTDCKFHPGQKNQYYCDRTNSKCVLGEAHPYFCKTCLEDGVIINGKCCLHDHRSKKISVLVAAIGNNWDEFFKAVNKIVADAQERYLKYQPIIAYYNTIAMEKRVTT